MFRGFTGSGNLTLPVAFCGYGISRPELGYDDYEKIDVKNKIVMVFKQNPSWKINDESWGQRYPREKSIIAFEHGAKGILFVSRPNDSKPQPLIGSVMHGEGEQSLDFPHLHLPTDTPETLNPDLFEKIVKLAYLAATEVADGNYKREAVKKKSVVLPRGELLLNICQSFPMCYNCHI